MIYGLVIILLAALLVYAVVNAQTVKPAPKRGKRGHVDKAMIEGRWNTIKLTSETGGNGLRSAISEADKLLDHVMREMGFGGETMAERLKQAERKLSNRNAVWQAHKLRNSMVHDIGFDLVPSMAKDALRAYERALKDLGAL